jgi:hypothetical protein
MTAPLLPGHICGAQLIQHAAGVGVGVRSSRRASKLLREAAEGRSVLHRRLLGPGWREFCVARRDTRTRHELNTLEPVDGTALPVFRPGQFLMMPSKASIADAES